MTPLRLFPAVLALLSPVTGHAAITFTSSATAAGITHRHYGLDAVAMGYYQQTGWMPGGAVAEDFNGDGFIDLYVVQGGSVPNLLYINCGDGTFKNEANTRGADISHPGVGAAAADYDNDGDIDICATSLNAPHYVLENDGSGNFVTKHLLPEPADFGMSPSWGDLDNDGQLELAIARWQSQSQFAVYRNLGNGNLKHTSPVLGSYYFSPVFADIDDDRWADLLLVADFTGTKYHLNTDGVSLVLGGAGTDQNGMGTAVGDYDNDGDLDWFVTAIKDDNGVQGGWSSSGNRLYRNDGNGSFTDVTDAAGVRNGFWGWGAMFADFDLDGDLDLFHVNGWAETFLETYSEFGETPARLFENLGDGTFQEIAVAAGADDHGQGRAVAAFDLENDGDVDIFIVNNQDSSLVMGALQSDPGTPVLLRNDTVTSNHWLKVNLQGEAPLHSDGIGSRVYLTAGGVTQMRELNASTGFLGHGSNRIAHFGLGGNSVVSQVRARWVNGDETIVPMVAADQAVTVRSPRGHVSGRRVAPGEQVTMSADPARFPAGATFQWSVFGFSYPNNSSVTFAGVGDQSIRLDVFSAGNTVDPLWTEVFAVQVVEAPLDTDGDKMPDSWEMANSLNKNSAFDAVLDGDLDKLSNLAEYYAGTDPNDPESVLSLVARGSLGEIELSWPSVAGKRYRILQSDDLIEWAPHPGWQTTIPGTEGTSTVVLPPDARFRALRVAVPNPN